MRLEREALREKTPLLTVQSLWVIPKEFIDDYGDHLNEALALKIYEVERLKIFSRDQMLKHGVLGVLKEQHPRYHAQVYEGDNVAVTTLLYVDMARFYFLHLMKRDSIVVQDNLVEGALVNSQRKPVRIPPAFLQELTAFNNKKASDPIP